MNNMDEWDPNICEYDLISSIAPSLRSYACE